MDNRKIITESPGKALISGGYLILNKKNKGISLLFDAYTTCSSKIIQLDDNNETISINFIIHSKLYDKDYKYFSTVKKNFVYLGYNYFEEKNNWIDNIVLSSLYFFFNYFLYNEDNKDIKEKFLNRGVIEISVEIETDYRFISYNKNILYNKSQYEKLPKTGLGSSSALISSLTTNIILALYSYYIEKIIIFDTHLRDIKYNYLPELILISSIYANYLSQNKTGSCFDIISSLLGSQIFQPINIDTNFNFPILSQDNYKKIEKSIKYFKEEYIPNIKFLSYNSKIKPYFLDIEKGSDTRILVKNVIEYGKKNQKNELFDDELFSELNNINNSLIEKFNILFGDDENLKNSVDFNQIKELNSRYINILSKISKQSKVDIIPDTYKELLENSLKLDDVIYSICPGAGGYDNMIILAKYNETIEKNIEKLVNDFDLKNIDNGIMANIIKMDFRFYGTEISVEKIKY